jgi:hypothetical protein
MQTEFHQDCVRTKLSTMKIKKDKFRPLFCGKDFYLKHQIEFSALQKISENLSEKNRLIIYTITLCCLRRKSDWYAGILKKNRKSDAVNKASPSTAYDLDFEIYTLFTQLQISWPVSLPKNISITDFLANIKIKAIPEAALSGLFHFYCGDYDLKILCYEPAPQEILKLQIQNQRVITFEADYTVWPDKKYGERDFLSFVLHDLIHAEHFLSDPQKRLGQIGFYKFLEKLMMSNLLDPYLLIPRFDQSFSYLISDMNSHVIHLLKTLKAIIDLENIATSTWTDISLFNCPLPEISQALSRINSLQFSPEDTDLILAFFETN